jgi:hypothetical protein
VRAQTTDECSVGAGPCSAAQQRGLNGKVQDESGNEFCASDTDVVQLGSGAAYDLQFVIEADTFSWPSTLTSMNLMAVKESEEVM